MIAYIDISFDVISRFAICIYIDDEYPLVMC